MKFGTVASTEVKEELEIMEAAPIFSNKIKGVDTRKQEVVRLERGQSLEKSKRKKFSERKCRNIQSRSVLQN